MKKGLLITLIVLIVIISLLITVFSPFGEIFGYSFLNPFLPTPEITYGEFPFRLEYRLGEETFVVEDAVICEYDGVKWNEGTGKHRAWKSYLKSNGHDDDVLILTDGDLQIFYSTGKPEYYMDDLKHYDKGYKPKAKFYYVTKNRIGSAEDMLDEYDIELVDWEFSKPIENTFSFGLQRILFGNRK